MSKWGLFFTLFIFSSCAGKQTVSSMAKLEKNYEVNDMSGRYRLELKQGFNKGKNALFTKYLLKESLESGKVVEQSVVLSTPGKLKKISILRPKESEYVVWFDKKKYKSRMNLDLVSKSLIIKLTSPEKRWQGKKVYPFPKTSGIFCYFLHLMNCAKRTGFLEKAVEKGAGQMRISIIWEGFPYFQEQYPDLGSSPFADGLLSYEGKNAKGEYRFTFNVAGQAIFYQVDKSMAVVRKNWVKQGYSMVEIH